MISNMALLLVHINFLPKYLATFRSGFRIFTDFSVAKRACEVYSSQPPDCEKIKFTVILSVMYIPMQAL